MDDIIDDTGSTVGVDDSPRQRLDALFRLLGVLFGVDFSGCTSDQVAVNVAGLLRLERQRAENTVRERDEARAEAAAQSIVLSDLAAGLEDVFDIVVDDITAVGDVLAALDDTRRGDDASLSYAMGREKGRIEERDALLAEIGVSQYRALSHGHNRIGMAYLCGALDAIGTRHSTDQGAV